MKDFEIIKQIEILLNVKLTHYHSNNVNYSGYYCNNHEQVTKLSIGNCKIINFGKLVNLLLELRELNYIILRSIQTTNFSRISLLKNIKKLEVTNCKISNVTFLSGMCQLTYLDLSQNDIKNIAPIKELTKLSFLNLRRNSIDDISPLYNLKKLNELNISNNNIFKIDSLGNLKNLKRIFFHSNSISDINILENFTKLTGIYCVCNSIDDISCLSNLLNLKDFYAGENNIHDLNPLKNLPNLKKIYLPDNNIEDLLPIKNIEKPTFFVFSNNPIKIIPEWITNFGLKIIWSDETVLHEENNIIILFNSVVENVPIEILKEGNDAIARYFNKIKQEGVDFIYEAKLTLVGEGSAGKTSLQKRLMEKYSDLPAKDTRTRGIEINDWKFKNGDDKLHVAHIWDFGGQDVYYPVHRFFITENSVFVLLASTRQTHHNFDYWIPTIYQFGGKSPIVLGQTCHDGNKISWNDLGVYLANRNFNIIKTQDLPYYELNLPNCNEGLEEIRRSIINQVTGLPRYGRGVPSSWVLVRSLLRDEAEHTACISFDKYKEICKSVNSYSFKNSSDFTDCCKFLHDIGVVLWYSNIEELKSWVILQPEWAMNAVYKIIDDNEIQARRGNIIERDFGRLWNEDCYDGKQNILKKMLEVFKIAFPKKHIKGDYIIPARLLSMPMEKKWHSKTSCLRLEYRYEFMPRGLVNQVSAELSRYIVSDEEVWNNAVNFSTEDNNSQCQVEEDFYNRKIVIRSKGADARALIILVMDALKNITEGYKGVKPQIYVPCTCQRCESTDIPTTFLYEKLLEWSANDSNRQVTCNESCDLIPIKTLLYNVGLTNPFVQLQSRKITIFLASSSELIEDRKEFELFINRENKILNKDNVFLNLEIWEDFIDSMSRTRLQDEYNKIISKCDIFISLFFTKVGKYTLEEFETAFGQFKRTGKPLVYTYFKAASVNTEEITEEIKSLLDFREKIYDLGHFRTTFKNVDDLKLQFKSQLEKILPNLN